MKLTVVSQFGNANATASKTFVVTKLSDPIPVLTLDGSNARSFPLAVTPSPPLRITFRSARPRLTASIELRAGAFQREVPDGPRVWDIAGARCTSRLRLAWCTGVCSATGRAALLTACGRRGCEADCPVSCSPPLAPCSKACACA
eukprot:7425369-Pyramimonas_sp.AAC.2